ncbi:MAG: carboxypeptidase regulatory-like domain-containing protein [Acidobacteriota bacterium]
MAASHRFACAAAVAWLASATLLAQSDGSGRISGRVVDARTGAGLARVLVLVEDGGPSAETGPDGSFSLSGIAPGLHRLFVSVVGYALVRRDVEVAAGGAAAVTIPLSEGTGTYTERVTVAADRFRPAEPAVASQQTLGSADIQNLRGVLADDPLRAVQVLPGVATGDDLRSEFSVRGSDFSHMNLTVDGFPTPFLLHTVRAVEDSSASGSVAMINSDILDEVTLLSGGYAQRDGNRTGAEVNFRLREGSRQRFQARAAVSGTSASAVLEGPLGRDRRGSWLVSARQSYLDLLLHRLSQEGLDFAFADAQAKLAYDRSPAQRFELTLLAGRSRMQEKREDTDTGQIVTGRNASAMAIGSWRVSKRRGVVTTRALASTNRFRNERRGVVEYDRGHDAQIAGRVDAASALTRGVQIAAGLQVDRTSEGRIRRRSSGGAYRVINEFDAAASRAGAYAQAGWTGGPLTLVAGARADRWSLTGETTASPWAQAELKTSASTSLRGGAGIYRQFPDFEQVIGALGSRTFRSERASQYDLGFEHRIGEAVRWQLTAFDREEDGFFRRIGAETRLVGGRVVRGAIGALYQPSLDGRARGVELLVQRRSTTGLSGWASYSFGRLRYQDHLTGETFWGNLDQRHTANLYLFSRLSARTSLSTKVRVGSNVPAPGYYEERDGGYYVASTRNRVRVPTYARVDVRANRTYNWSRRRLTLFAEVMNLLNRDNVRFSPPGVNTRTGQATGLFESMIPVVPSAGILIEF